jgi:uncharacterized metal-binding protein
MEDTMSSEETKSPCGCDVQDCLIFACSGGADVGGISDQAARRLTIEKAGRMFCLAGIGGRIEGILKTTEKACKILVIDGCPIDCAKKTLEQAGFTEFLHLQIADLGLQKGQSPCNTENITKVAEKGKELLSTTKS